MKRSLPEETSLCQGHYKNGDSCRYKAKKDGYCLLHFKEKDSSKVECGICLNIIEKREKIILNCNHVFCENCIREWLTRKNSCPFCRTKVQMPIYQRLGIKDAFNMQVLMEFLSRIDFLDIPQPQA